MNYFSSVVLKFIRLSMKKKKFYYKNESVMDTNANVHLFALLVYKKKCVV